VASSLTLYEFVPSLVHVLDSSLLSIPPWELAANVEALILQESLRLGPQAYRQHGNFWIHHSARVETNVQFRGAGIIKENCLVASNAYLRGGIILGANTVVGPSVELKSIICCGHSDFAHLNYVGNSVVGKGVNFEGGSVVANHLNEKPGTTIRVKIGEDIVDTKQLKFGALVGDNCNIGANSVLSPGTILEPNTKVPRLSLLEQVSR
jgi:UDP-N-acetylglucosamine diphosphorylase / glucose-1-phosphate thymidylyltransferase / UDP-N-acetylgalactosamine diphosphorylase / glucosamine-1-phosphate N-acetyltransferase / galactosamine-1-phosphate N-acetyltransferase